MLKDQRNGRASVGVFTLILGLCAIGIVMADSPIFNFTPQGAMQADLNAGGHSITNAASVVTTNLTVSGVAALSTNTTAGGARVLTTNDDSSFDPAGAASTAQSTAESYASSQASTAQSTAETYAASQASAAQSNAIAYASTNVTPVTWTVVSTNFTAAQGGHYMVDTRSAAVTATLPASFPATRSIDFRDAYLSWGTNALNVARNGLLINQQTNTYVDAVQGDKLSATSLDGTNITVQ